ncbi:MAG: PEGA domain-containing protein [Spirochaetaceae bacterium]|nr:MAG: PEGA domain-containing protein [Spirochaetaceae bacterium]
MSSALFLTTDPINADVLLDGEPLEEQTPLLLRVLEAGRHDLEVRKQGYRTERREIEIAAGEIRTVVIELASLSFSPVLPEEQRVIIYGAEEGDGDILYQLPEGNYSFTREKGALRIEPIFPQDGWIRGLNMAIPLSLGFSTVLCLHDIFYPKRAALEFSENFSLSPASLSAIGLSLTLISFDIVLYAGRAKAKSAFTYAATPREQALHSAKEYYDRAENLLSLGQLEEALRFYTRVLEGYKDSPLYPNALFKTARIHFLTGEDSLATIEFNLIADHYPLPDLFDKAQRGLADILLRRGAYRESIEQLQHMVLADPLYSEEEIELLKAEIREAWFGDDPSIIDEVIDAYGALIHRYSDSESVDLYRYKAAYYLHLGERDEEAKELLETIDPAALDEDLMRRIQDLRRSLEAVR